MAIDTAQKRASALGMGLPPGVVLPIPDGTIDAADRAQLAGSYISAATVVSIAARWTLSLSRSGAVKMPR